MNPDYPAAWILLGHEFVEGKNHAAAINAYREALGKMNFSTNNDKKVRLLQISIAEIIALGTVWVKRTKLSKCTTMLYTTSKKRLLLSIEGNC